MTTTMADATTLAPACGLATDIAGGENASPAAAGPHAPYATHPNSTKETIPMTDQIFPAGYFTTIEDMADWIARAAIATKDTMRKNAIESLRGAVEDALASAQIGAYDAARLETNVALLMWGDSDGDLDVSIFGDDDGILSPGKLCRARKVEPLTRYVRDALHAYRDGAATTWRERNDKENPND